MSRTPDFILKSLNKATEHRTGKIGCGWKNEDGSLTLSLDVALLPDPNCVLTLFPNDAPKRGARRNAPRMADLPVSVMHRCQ